MIVGCAVLLIIIALLLVTLVLCMDCNTYPGVRGVLVWLKTQLMFSSAIRYLLQGFFPVALGAFYNMKTSFGDENEVLNCILSFCTIMVLLYFTGFCYFFVHLNEDKLHTLEFKDKYGAFYTGVEYHNNHQALSYTFYFCIRRLFITVIIVFCQSSVVL